ncbi:MAG: hypothetical protein IPH59_08730 [bacterium]|nr:hypothetical protein [bacterium]
MINSICSILSFKAFIARSDDPLTHFSRKVGGHEFTVVILGHQHIKYAKARLKNKKLHLGQPHAAFCENFQTAEMDTTWVGEMLNETAGAKYLLLGINTPFSNIKIYPADHKLREVERAFATNLEAEVGRTFEKQMKYFLSQAGGRVCLNAVEKERIAQPIEKFRHWGYEVVSVFHYPTAVLAYVSTLPLDWDNPGVLVYYTQKLIVFMGWHKGEIVTVRSRLIAETQRGGTGTRPTLNALSKEIDTTLQIVSGKAASEVANIYVYHDRQDPAFGGLESIQRNTKPLAWASDHIESQVQPYPEPDLGIIRESHSQIQA